MPNQTRARADDKERTARVQEQEFKRARGAISCAECRRLKLKCDKTVPCSSCKRRGCSSICPNGALTTGQGTRFILADTDRLHRKIAEMSDRIRQLEDALALLQSSVSREAHPLLARDFLTIKSGLELHVASSRNGENGGTGDGGDDGAEEDSQYIDAFGTLAVRDDGAATFYGRSAGSEPLTIPQDESPALSLAAPSGSASSLPPTLSRLTTTFPSAPTLDLSVLLAHFLPPWPRAAALCDLYLEQAPWFFGAVTKRQLAEEVIPLFYPEAAPSSSGALSSSASAFALPSTGADGKSAGGSSHDLALLFVVFCFGALTDSTLPPAPHNGEAAQYYELARAALNVESPLERPPAVATVQTLSLMAIYQGLVADENSIESTWSLMGLSSKLAQSIGLHRDCARWKLTPAEVQKRRALFWELFITDCWQALATGRLPTFGLPFVDTELPADPDETLADDGAPQPSFPAWKARWGRECVSEVVQGTLTARAPKYTVILELDRKLRDVPLPRYAQGPPPPGAGLSQTMSHFMPINYLHLTLLYVHRCFFAQALTDHPSDPLRSQYAPSFLAGYRSACAFLGTVRDQFELFPVQIARFWVLWTHGFSAAVMLASIVTHCGATKTAQAALGELRLAYDLFEKAAKHGGRAVKFLPIVRRLHDKAYQAYTKGLPPVPPRDGIFAQRTDAREDELSIFSGRTRTVATKAKPAASSPGSGAGTSASSGPGSKGGSERSSESPQAVEAFPALESYGASVHPALVDQMRTFSGELDLQISAVRERYMVQQQQQQQQQQQYEGNVQYGLSGSQGQVQYDSPGSSQGQYSSPGQFDSPSSSQQQYDSPVSQQQYDSPGAQQQYANAGHGQQYADAQYVSTAQQQYPSSGQPYANTAQQGYADSAQQGYANAAQPEYANSAQQGYANSAPHQYADPVNGQQQYNGTVHYDTSQQYAPSQQQQQQYDGWHGQSTQGSMPPSGSMPPPPVPAPMHPPAVSTTMPPPPVPAHAQYSQTQYSQTQRSQLVSVAGPVDGAYTSAQHSQTQTYGAYDTQQHQQGHTYYNYTDTAPAPSSGYAVPQQPPSWHPPAAQDAHFVYDLPPPPPPPPAEHAQHNATPSHSRRPSMNMGHAPGHGMQRSQSMSRSQSISRSASMSSLRGHAQEQMQPAAVIPVLPSAPYSLQETWMSFMQHELPGFGQR
ncbi:hypothetical protein WOLCODRAFT_127620 [Wolfiporia cocos MD-104 SS10]|uniref:Zn(2)-C6 fungal-type domain-containing protein n=1 Tax=Wolfiporia cocos (strain MD-104) TaxID=742152 RepID=A0A2H3JGD8_WOLCO|nr:hypothetical protein WOLCODRAFT_127620 [Wolfiporia cocos MD-104 SS10]